MEGNFSLLSEQVRIVGLEYLFCTALSGQLAKKTKQILKKVCFFYIFSPKTCIFAG